MKFTPQPASKIKQTFSINLLVTDLNLLKTWAFQAGIAPADLGRQIIEHLLTEHRAEILNRANYKIEESA